MNNNNNNNNNNKNNNLFRPKSHLLSAGGAGKGGVGWEGGELSRVSAHAQFPIIKVNIRKINQKDDQRCKKQMSCRRKLD